jgi:hypothetical protein
VSYVGHPLADMLPLEDGRHTARTLLDISPATPVFALLPGSRQSELQYMAETFIETARRMHEQIPEAIFVAPLTTRETRVLFESALHRRGAKQLPIRLLFGHAHQAMMAADAVLVASGTATLEAALLKRPMAIVYKMAPLSYRMMRRMGYLPYVGLPNVLAGRFVVPEFIQDEATAENLAQALLNLYADRRGVRAHQGRISGDPFAVAAERRREGSAAAVIACLPRTALATSMPLLLPVEGLVCGVDEAGRGPLAGPVVAAAVILDPGRPISGLNDSKKLSAGKRELLAAEIRGSALAWAVAEASVAEIDQINILQASLLAMQRAVAALAGAQHGPVFPSHALVDGCHCPQLSCSRSKPSSAATARSQRLLPHRFSPRPARCRHARAARQLSAVRF